jgi:dienelactone hydrolase
MAARQHSRVWWAGRKLAVPALLLTLTVLLWRPAAAHFRAAGLLMRIQNPGHPGWLAEKAAFKITESASDVATPSGPVQARLYVPQGVPDAPGIVIVHGVHRLGIGEPRLVALARAMAASGIRVLTPELASLADYRVEPGTIDLIGVSARSFAGMLHRKVGVLGISFGGGLALLAASDPHYAGYVRFVMTLGAHDDLERVTEFYVTNKIRRPDGSTLHMQAHDYGPLVLIYSHVEDFFPPADVEIARNALRLLLWEKPDDSKRAAQSLSPPSRRTMELLYEHNAQPLYGEMQDVIAHNRMAMAAVSPHGRMGTLHAPVFLLHGAGDNVIPPSELLWLQQDVPQAMLHSALVSPAISHASMEDAISLEDQFELVHFMAEVLETADDQQVLASP